MDETDDFYEEDEPLADVIAAFEGGEKGRTAPTPDLPASSRGA